MTKTARIELELTAEQARVIRNAFLPANPNKLRTKNVVVGTSLDGKDVYGPPTFDGKTLAALAHEVIAALEAVARITA